MPTVGHGEVSPAHPVAIRWSLRETRRRLSGGFFPGFEELVDDPAGGSPDDIVADRVVMDTDLLPLKASRLHRVDRGVEQLAHRRQQQALDLVWRQHQVIDAALDQADHRGDHKAADGGEDVVEFAEHRHSRRLEADLLVALAQRGFERFPVRILSLTTGEGDLALVREDRVGASREEQVDTVVARHHRNQHARPHQRRYGLDRATDTALQHLPQPLEAGARGGRRVPPPHENRPPGGPRAPTPTRPPAVPRPPPTNRTGWGGPLIPFPPGRGLP